MIAVLDYVDGFGNDTYVSAIFSTLEEAKSYALEKSSNGFFKTRWQDFNFGEVDFDYYEANSFT